jgi:hypothetical protein
MTPNTAGFDACGTGAWLRLRRLAALRARRGILR